MLGVFVLTVGVAAHGQVGAIVPDWAPSSTRFPSGGIRTTGEVTNLLPFIGITPCRIVDTRGPAGPYGAPGLSAGVPRDFALRTGPCPGIPVEAAAYSVNVTVTNAAGPGFILIYPQGGSQPLASTLNYVAGQTVANAAIVSAGPGSVVTVVAGVSGTDLILDINGYFSPTPGVTSDSLAVANTGHYAIRGETRGSGSSDAGVYGLASSATGATYGVWGENASSTDGAAGVFGSAEGASGITTGVWGRTVSSSDESTGVVGLALGTTGRLHGVFGYEASPGPGSAGVRGIDYSGSPPGSTGFVAAGARGESNSNPGVLGISQNAGVGGILVNSTGVVLATGTLGANAGGTNYGVYAGAGTIGCNGCTKQFVDPHPTDPTRTIHYVSLEGPEAGTYFRGTSRTADGQAVIEVPDHFRWVTQEEGMTVQLTPVGELAMMAVVHQDLHRIVVRSSRDVTFHYLVQGIRPAHRDFRPVVDGSEYAPDSAADRMKEAWPAWTKRRLIENGTYNADGTVNMETAERVGWTKAWAQRDARAHATALEAARPGQR
jgi:hypothetical protein